MSKSQSIRQISEVLSRAFLNDPFYTYIMPNPAKRPAQLRWWMRNLLRYGFRNGEVQVTPEPIGGAAIWLPPAHESPESWKMFWTGMGLGPFRLGWRGFRRMLRLIQGLEARRRCEPPPFWYLMILGVDPDRQGQGIGSALLHDTLSQADQDGRNCYLETMTERNVRFYQRQGFQAVSQAHLDGAGPCWTMRRPPLKK